MLRATGATRRYGTTVTVHRLDRQVDPGEVSCPLGAEGAGKTTTVRLFLGSPTAGGRPRSEPKKKPGRSSKA